MSDNFLTQLQAASSQEEREWLLLHLLLTSQPPAVQEAVWAAAIPHWFDLPFLAALLDKPADELEETFFDLTALSFVELFAGRGYNIHERSRHLLLRHLWQTDQPRYRTLSSRAAANCAAQGPQDPAWRIETIYHLLIAQPDQGTNQLQNTGWEWHNSPHFAYDKVETMAQAAHEHAVAGRLNQRGQGWTLFWQGVLDIDYSRYREARDKLNQITITPDQDPYLAADSCTWLGDAYRILDEYGQARERYEAALPIYRQIGDRLGEANCIRSLGELLGEIGQIETAINSLEEAANLYRAIKLKNSEASCFNSMGNLFHQHKQYEKAANAYQQAIYIDPYAMWYRNRADTYIKMALYSAASEDLEIAETLQPGQPYTFLHRGRVALLGEKQIEQAISQFQQAIILRPALNVFHFWLVYAYLANNNYLQAKESLQQGLRVTYKTKDIDDAIEELEKLEQIYGVLPHSDELRQQLALKRLEIQKQD